MRKKPLLKGSLSDEEAYYKRKNASLGERDEKTQGNQKFQHSGVKGGAAGYSSPTEHLTVQLNELTDMYEHGLLSEREFERARTKLLKGY